MIPDLTIGDLTIDCVNAERARDFYADLLGWEKTIAYGALAVKAGNGMTILFWEPDIPYVPPVWPEEPGKQQKQMHLDFTVDDVPSAVEKAIRLGATKADAQYGDYYVTMIDTEGHPFCLCRRSSEKSEYDLYYEKQGWGLIPDISFNIDCKKSEVLREFYANLMPWDNNLSWVLVPENRMIVHFMGCDFEYITPVWPEEPGQQQKQMHFNFQVDDLQSAVEEAVRLGATKAVEQYGGDHFVTLLDTEGHPFCLCRRGNA
jgi:catechol 2,3-dioxygenase-like lactoylglutathione lyase family enzyme